MPVIKDGPSCGLTRGVLIDEIAKGETLSSIERAWGMKFNTIHNWVKKWDLKGINQAKAQSLLDKPIVKTVEEKPSTMETPLLREKDISQVPDLQEEMSTLRQEDMNNLRQANACSKAEIDSLIRERDEYRMAVDELSEQVASQDEVLELLNRTKGRLSDLEKEHEDLLIQMEQRDAATETIKKDPNSCYETLVELGVLQEPADPVNHPQHYNRGGIECIDAIEAATSGLSGSEAYNTGAAIKYLWRWKWKNGREDLEKAAWYLKRLIGNE